MCKCNPSIRTPYCGGPGCEDPNKPGLKFNTPGSKLIDQDLGKKIQLDKLFEEIREAGHFVIFAGFMNEEEISKPLTDSSRSIQLRYLRIDMGLSDSAIVLKAGKQDLVNDMMAGTGLVQKPQEGPGLINE